MRTRKLSRWQKASALVPMAVLVGAWGAALGTGGLASAIDGTDDASSIPSVPGTAFDQPASVQDAPAGIDPRAGTDGTLATLATNGIPVSALSAYRRGETLLAQADAACQLPWHLLAAVGRVESNHGRINGSELDASGTATPPIYGPLLDGKNGTAKITDTDGGALDDDPVFDRAVGPMQFIPGTWSSVAVDSDNDGSKNPQNINDAATAAGIYLCAGEGNLSDPTDLRAAVLRYNRSGAYADTVIAISQAYAKGDFTQTPNGLSSSAPLVRRSSDQSISASDRQAAVQAEQQFNNDAAAGGNGAGTPAAGGGSTGGTTPGGSTGGGTGGGTPVPVPGTPAPPQGLTGLVGGLTGQPAPGTTTPTNPITNTLSWAEAQVQCLASGISVLDVAKLGSCITRLLS